MATIKYLNGVPIPQAYSDALSDYEGLKSTTGSLHVATDPLPAGTNIIGLAKLSDGTDILLINSNGSINVVNVNAAGTELFTSGNPGQIVGKISADDAALAQLGTLAAVAVIDPTASASTIALLKGLLKQLQGAGTGKTPILDQTETATTAPVTAVVTLTETPIALTTKDALKQITIRNRDFSIRARIGEVGMTPANDKGYSLEPGAAFQQEFDPSVAVTLYGRSEGASIQVEVIQI